MHQTLEKIKLGPLFLEGGCTERKALSGNQVIFLEKSDGKSAKDVSIVYGEKKKQL